MTKYAERKRMIMVKVKGETAVAVSDLLNDLGVFFKAKADKKHRWNMFSFWCDYPTYRMILKICERYSAEVVEF